MFPMTCIAVTLASLMCFATLAVAAGNSITPKRLLEQAKGLPADFEEHLFDVPLAVQVERDSQLVGEALIVLSRDDPITLLEFTDYNESQISPNERDIWADHLKQGTPLGACTSKCPEQLLAIHYNLENSMVSLLTAKAEQQFQQSQYYDLPIDGSTGLILRNQLNLTGGQQEYLGGRYGLEASSSLGKWTQTLNLQLNRIGGPQENQIRHAVYSAYTQRELPGSFLRLGYFIPGSEGLTRQIRTLGDNPDTAFGVMYGSSDSLSITLPKPSIYPIYVTPNRQATAQIYRNGVLINTQPVAAGLQSLDTRPLPGGIYEVQVRLVEDDQVSSTTTELVYKPSNWRNLDNPWRYNLFAGRESTLLSNWDDKASGEMTAGGAVNYLLHPRVVLGVSGRQVKGNVQWGTSIDWTLSGAVGFYANLYQTKNHGTGVDLNSQYNYGTGSIIFTHNRSWLDTRDTYETLPDGTYLRPKTAYLGQVSRSSASLNHRFGVRNTFSARLSHSDGYTQGYGLDLGWTQMTHLFGSDGNWRLSVFDRPASLSSANTRNRGFDLSFSLALGGPGERWSASLGSRTSRDGERNNNASLSYSKDLKDHTLQSVAATANIDAYGIGLNGRTSFQLDAFGGDLFLQRSSYNGNFSGGLNLDSTVALSGSKLAMTSQPGGQGAGLIVDVESDVADIDLRADDLSGSSTVLRPGRNFIPITAYKNSSVSFDFQGTDVPAAAIQPPRTRYHLNKGGVGYRKINVAKTVTVLGRLLDPQGKPLKGHHIINHASRGVSEVDGFFSMEMNAGAPTLEVRKGEALLCQLAIDMSTTAMQANVLEIGDVRCIPETLTRSVTGDNVAGL